MLLCSCLRLDVSYHAGQSVKSLRVKVQHGLQLVLGHHEAVVQTATWTWQCTNWNLEDSRKGFCVALTEWVRNLTSLGFSIVRQLWWIRLAISACLSSEQTYVRIVKNTTYQIEPEKSIWKNKVENCEESKKQGPPPCCAERPCWSTLRSRDHVLQRWEEEVHLCKGEREWVTTYL